jgi:hypothetical protein
MSLKSNRHFLKPIGLKVSRKEIVLKLWIYIGKNPIGFFCFLELFKKTIHILLHVEKAYYYLTNNGTAWFALFI